MLDFLKTYKTEIENYLSEYLGKMGAELSAVNDFGPQLADDLRTFVQAGKMIRGGLVFLGDEICGGKADRKDLITIGAALEMFQSALLIHDDIMDRDTRRRGGLSLFALYAERNKELDDHYHLGESLGICAGDVALFYGFELISLLSAPADTILRLYELFSREMLIVGTAQMRDVMNGASKEFPASCDVINLYKYKTGRYTFSLPLIAGAILSGADKKTIEKLERIGELMGVVFQIRDDYLGLFGDPKKTGKPVGSDIDEGKKTLHMRLLRDKLSEAEKIRLDDILSSNSAGQKQIGEILDWLNRHGINEKLNKLTVDYIEELKAHIGEFTGCRDSGKEKLIKIISYLSARDY